MSVLVFRVGLAARQWWCDDESINWNVSSIWAAFLNDFGKCWPMKQRSLRLQIDFYYKYTVRKKLIYILAKPKFNSFYWTRMKEKMLTPIRISICYFFLSHKHTIKKKRCTGTVYTVHIANNSENIYYVNDVRHSLASASGIGCCVVCPICFNSCCCNYPIKRLLHFWYNGNNWFRKSNKMCAVKSGEATKQIEKKDVMQPTI